VCIRTALLRASLAVNREMVLLDCRSAARFSRVRSKRGRGAKVIDRLAADLRRSIPT
jgi:hypothetical protein